MTTLTTAFETAFEFDIDDFIELDDDTQFENFRNWLTSDTMIPVVPPKVFDALGTRMDRPFAVFEPNAEHNYGITWSSPDPDVTRCANQAMNYLVRSWNALPDHVKDTHPNFSYWFHQGGSSEPTGWQYWEWLGMPTDIKYFVCELLVTWVQAKTAEYLERVF